MKLRLVISAFVLLAALTALAGERPECSICGMWIDRYMSTRHVVTLSDSSTAQLCSVACAHKFQKARSGDIRLMQVADYESHELLEAEKATYVRGSDAPPVMSAESWVAFATKQRAREFLKLHGGNLSTFKKAMKSFDALQ